MSSEPEILQMREALARERKRVELLKQKLADASEELEVLRGTAYHASTSRLMAEEELDETRDRLQLALDAAGLALWEWNTQTSDVFLNAKWSEMMGDLSIDTHCQIQDILNRVHPDDLPHLQQQLIEAAQGKQPRYSSQFRIRTLFDEWLWLESHGMATDQDRMGQAQRVIAVCADIRERMRLQQATEAARQQAEAANKAKTEFLANVSHEVRTPLNGVMGLIRLMTESPLNPEQTHWLQLMDESAHTLLGLLNDILDLSKIEAGKMSLEIVPFDVSELTSKVCAPLVAQADAKQLDFDLAIHPGLPPSVLGDPGRLRQVLTNLLSNAVKFTPAGGEVRVTAEPQGENSVRFEVADTGIGITPEQQTRVFEAFTQADASTTRKFGGTGLGLAISAKLVEMMGGKIKLASAVGQGSSFSFVLPLTTPEAAQTDSGPLSAPMELEHIKSESESFAGLNVLVAEDHPINELLMRQLLNKLGCNTTMARNGLEAIAAWKRGGIDLIMMDVQMPELSGLDATAEIRAQEGALRQHTPIVAVTANAMSGDREKCMVAGMDSYTSKPVSPQALMQAMRQALDASEQWQRGALAHTITSPANKSAAAKADAPPPNAASARAGINQAPPLDVEKLRRRLDGDDRALVDLARGVRTEMTHRLQALRLAMDARDQIAATTQAHSLKGSLASITAHRAAALTNGLEMAARSGEWPLFTRALPVLRSEMEKLDRALQDIVEQGKA